MSHFLLKLIQPTRKYVRQKRFFHFLYTQNFVIFHEMDVYSRMTSAYSQIARFRCNKCIVRWVFCLIFLVWFKSIVKSLSEYIKIDAFLLILCNVISDVIWSPKTSERTPKTQIIQKAISKHQIEAANGWIIFHAWM